MMRVIPTWVVTFGEITFRVPETHLESFLHILLFNGIAEFQARREPKPGRAT